MNDCTRKVRFGNISYSNAGDRQTYFKANLESITAVEADFPRDRG